MSSEDSENRTQHKDRTEEKEVIKASHIARLLVTLYQIDLIKFAICVRLHNITYQARHIVIPGES